MRALYALGSMQKNEIIDKAVSWTFQFLQSGRRKTDLPPEVGESDEADFREACELAKSMYASVLPVISGITKMASESGKHVTPADYAKTPEYELQIEKIKQDNPVFTSKHIISAINWSYYLYVLR